VGGVRRLAAGTYLGRPGADKSRTVQAIGRFDGGFHTPAGVSPGSTSSTSRPTATTRIAPPATTGVARLVRARRGAARTVTTPSGLRSVGAWPSSPIIESRPTVGIENRF